MDRVSNVCACAGAGVRTPRRSEGACGCGLGDVRRGASVVSFWWSRVRPQVARVIDAGAVPALKAMLVSGAEGPNGVHNAVGALARICAVPEGRDAAFAAGVPVALETAFETASPGARSTIAWAISNLCVRSWLVYLYARA